VKSVNPKTFVAGEGSPRLGADDPTETLPVEAFEFTPEMSVGNATLDADHQAFFDLARLISDTPHGRYREQVVSSALTVLEEYVDGHFWREEKAMRVAGFPHLEEHRLRHAQFRARVRTIAGEVRQGNVAAAAPLALMLAEWLKKHIAVEDKRYEGFLIASQVDDRPMLLLSIEARAIRGEDDEDMDDEDLL